jgi:pimeloyl-ACP methyl ester carboxylesterase
MSTRRIHQVIAADGASIVGTVHGDGPPLLFVQGIMGDGDVDWQALVGQLSDRFTCFLPSWRGRGRSGAHPDVSFGRLVDDVRAYTDSIAGPVGLVGWSAGANLALLAAGGAPPDAVHAVAMVGPSMPWLMDEHERAVLARAVARMGELAAEGRSTEAMRAFAAAPFTDNDIVVAEEAGYFEAVGRYVPHLLDVQQQAMAYEGRTPADPAVLGAISAAVLVLYGSQAKSNERIAARHVAAHVPDGRTQQLAGAGHAVPLTHPQELAAALTAFLSPSGQPTGPAE